MIFERPIKKAIRQRKEKILLDGDLPIQQAFDCMIGSSYICTQKGEGGGRMDEKGRGDKESITKKNEEGRKTQRKTID